MGEKKLMEETRTQNSIRNVRTGAIVQFINKIMAFFVRTVFIKTLNTEYLGLNGLFTNILTMLAFSELGIGTAIIYSMYKPIAEDNREKIKSLLNLYKKCYFLIGLVIATIGICVIPFMRFFIKETPDVKENIVFIYLLFLTNTATSYFFTYKRSIITAFQKQSIINNIESVFVFIKSILEVLFLIITHNYIIYLFISIGINFLCNLYISKEAEKLYPFIIEKNIQNIDKSEKKSIFKNVKSLVVYKFGAVVLEGTDNILISSLINVNMVGLCSNYTLIIQAVKGVITTALNGIIASIGNLNATNDKNRKESILYELTFVYYIIYSFCCSFFITLLNPFIKIWLGDNFLLDFSVSIALACSFFIDGMRNPGFIYRTTLGLFSKGKITPYIASIVNILTSIVLCKMVGVAGIFIGTCLAQLSSYVWIDPYLIYRYEFEKSPFKYYKKIVIYYITFVLIIISSIFITSLFNYNGIIGLVVKAILTGMVFAIINIIIYYSSVEFSSLRRRLLGNR